MPCKNKKIFAFFTATILLHCFFAMPVFAADLEITYPTLYGGGSIGSGTALPEYLKYVFDFGMFVGFLTVALTFVFAGVLYIIAPAKPSALAAAKDRLSGAFTGLLILAALYLIITTINPQLRFFQIKDINDLPPPKTPEKAAGVYLHAEGGCPTNDNARPEISSIADLGTLTNKVVSSNIVNHPAENLNYIGILYDLMNFSGKCAYIQQTSCFSTIPPFADSVSIYQFDPRPSENSHNDGVYIYRNSFFDESGGFIKISNKDIQKQRIYVASLSGLKYQNPSSKDPQTNPHGCTTSSRVYDDCILWKEKGVCQERDCPPVIGNIGSIKIAGDYIVILVYRDEHDDSKGPWSYCQEFPAMHDVSQSGPKQIKWEPIMQIGKNPNAIIVIPVKTGK